MLYCDQNFRSAGAHKVYTVHLDGDK